MQTPKKYPGIITPMSFAEFFDHLHPPKPGPEVGAIAQDTAEVEKKILAGMTATQVHDSTLITSAPEGKSKLNAWLKLAKDLSKDLPPQHLIAGIDPAGSKSFIDDLIASGTVTGKMSSAMPSISSLPKLHKNKHVPSDQVFLLNSDYLGPPKFAYKPEEAMQTVSHLSLGFDIAAAITGLEKEPKGTLDLFTPVYGGIHTMHAQQVAWSPNEDPRKLNAIAGVSADILSSSLVQWWQDKGYTPHVWQSASIPHVGKVSAVTMCWGVLLVLHDKGWIHPVPAEKLPRKWLLRALDTFWKARTDSNCALQTYDSARYHLGNTLKVMHGVQWQPPSKFGYEHHLKYGESPLSMMDALMPPKVTPFPPPGAGYWVYEGKAISKDEAKHLMATQKFSDFSEALWLRLYAPTNVEFHHAITPLGAMPTAYVWIGSVQQLMVGVLKDATVLDPETLTPAPNNVDLPMWLYFGKLIELKKPTARIKVWAGPNVPPDTGPFL